MKICQVSPCFYPAWEYGGQARVAYEVSRRLAKRGHEITIYTTDSMNGTERLDRGIKNIENMNIHYFKNISNLLAWYQRIAISPGMIPVMRNEIKNFDIIHIHGFRDFQSAVVHHYACKYGIPYILQPHGSVPRLGKNKTKIVFDILSGYQILKDSDRVLVLNTSEKEICEKMDINRKRIEIISNGIDLSEYCNLPKKGLFKRQYKIPDNEMIILYLGRIHESKGLELLLRTFSKILGDVGNLKLVIAGTDDGHLQTLRDLSKSLKVETDVIFTGFLNNEEKLMAYADADIFVTPSFTGFPLTFLESMIFGVPIVTTNMCDIITWINNEVGYVVRYDENDIKDAIIKVLTNDGLQRRFYQNCVENVAKYDWDIITDRIEEIYESVLTNNKYEGVDV